MLREAWSERGSGVFAPFREQPRTPWRTRSPKSGRVLTLLSRKLASYGTRQHRMPMMPAPRPRRHSGLHRQKCSDNCRIKLRPGG